MSDTKIILLSACATLFGGVILLIVTELLKVMIISPAQRTREQIQAVLSRIDFYCAELTNFFPAEPSEHEIDEIKSIKKDFREAATDLKSNYTLVPVKRFLSFLRVLPSHERIDVAFTGLIYLHNSILYEGRRAYITNLIEMNDNQIDRIHAALTGKDIPERLKPLELRRK
jgi:hypothetical protein